MQMQEIQEGLTNALRATPGLGLSQEQARKAVEVMFTHLGIKKMAQSVLVPDSSCHLPLYYKSITHTIQQWSLPAWVKL